MQRRAKAYGESCTSEALTLNKGAFAGLLSSPSPFLNDLVRLGSERLTLSPTKERKRDRIPHPKKQRPRKGKKKQGHQNEPHGDEIESLDIFINLEERRRDVKS